MTPTKLAIAARAMYDDAYEEVSLRRLHLEERGNRNRQLLGLRGALAGDKTGAGTPNSVNTSSSLPVASNLTIPLHAHSGSHHVYIYVGSPPQRQIVSYV